MSWTWLAAAFGFALVDWYYVAVGRYRWRALTKPMVILALLAGFTLAGGWQGRTHWFGLGLLCCLAGDVFMLLPPKFFIAAILTFLPGYVFYSSGFIHGTLLFEKGSALPIIAAAGLAIVDAFGYYKLHKALNIRPGGRWLRIPILVYQLVLSLILVSALYSLQQPDLPKLAPWLYLPGAALLFISDLVLAYNRFITPVRNGRLIVTASYHIGQMALISGVLLRG